MMRLYFVVEIELLINLSDLFLIGSLMYIVLSCITAEWLVII